MTRSSDYHEIAAEARMSEPRIDYFTVSSHGSGHKLQAMSARGEIPGAAKLGRQWTYDLAKLRRFVEQQEQATKCQNEKPRPAATGATGFSMPSFKSGGSKSGGRLGQMIQQLQKRVAKQSKSGH